MLVVIELVNGKGLYKFTETGTAVAQELLLQGSQASSCRQHKRTLTVLKLYIYPLAVSHLYMHCSFKIGSTGQMLVMLVPKGLLLEEMKLYSSSSNNTS